MSSAFWPLNAADSSLPSLPIRTLGFLSIYFVFGTQGPISNIFARGGSHELYFISLTPLHKIAIISVDGLQVSLSLRGVGGRILGSVLRSYPGISLSTLPASLPKSR